MECCSLRSPALTTVPSSLSRTGLLGKPLLLGQVLKLSNLKAYQHARNHKLLRIKAQASSTKQFGSESAQETSKNKDRKNDNVVFVAGATGRVGSRTVRELLKLGFKVRAGVRSVQKANILVQSVKQLKLNSSNASEGSQSVEKLEIVECDLEKRDQIRPALGDASVVICCIGASEKEIFDVTGPYRIDYLATKNLIEAATIAKVNQFILLTSLGTNKVGFPAAILNLFWGVLIWKRKAEEALIASGLPYTIVRPGGMERPTDAYKETHNVTVSPEDTLFGGQVSNLQVAELMACMAKNLGRSQYKIVEVIAETTAPLTPLEELLAKIPSAINVFPKEAGATGGLTSSLSESVASEELTITAEKETGGIKVPEQSLSPYLVYDDLKPPTSPTPTPPIGQNNFNADVYAQSTSTPPVSEPASDAQSITAELEISITEAKPATEQALTKPLSPYVAYEDLKPPSSPSPTPSGPTKVPTSNSTQVDVVAAGDNDAAETTETVVEKDSPQNLSSLPNPGNDDVKPPVSTTITQSVSQQDLKVVDGVSDSASDPETIITTEAKQASQNSLSPYIAYEDLKPPSSPSPTPSGPRKPISVSTTVDVASAGGNDTSMIISADVEKVVRQSPTYHLSPYPIYDDLKPPTSPSPNAPVSAADTLDGQPQLSTLSANITEQNPTPYEPTDQEHHTEPENRPLSPFTMYEDMKPPASPSPSPRKLCS